MKKLIILLLVLTMIFALAACDGDKPNNEAPLNRDPGTTQGGEQGGNNTPGGNTQGNIDIGGIMSGNGGSDKIISEADSAYKEALIQQAAEEGMTVSFGNDGSTTLIDEEGNKYIQSKDGHWSYEGANGEKIDIDSGKWPDNEFTRAVPKPNMTVGTTVSEDSEFTIMFDSATTMDSVKAYAEQLKNKGFVIDAETNEETNAYMTVFSYSASNSSGYSVNLVHTSVAGTVTVVLSIEKNVD